MREGECAHTDTPQQAASYLVESYGSPQEAAPRRESARIRQKGADPVLAAGEMQKGCVESMLLVQSV
jgi:hypothetical protein